MATVHDMATVLQWDAARVGQFLSELQLESLIPAFKDNGVSGADLVGLTDADFTESLGCTPFQIRKIRAAVGVGAPPASPAAPPSPPTPPTLAASPALTPPAAAASPAGPTPAFAATDLYAYKELRAQISALEARGVDDQAAQARQVAAAEQASLRAVQQQLEAATAAQTLAQKKVDGAQGCGLGRLCASKAKQQEKAAALTLALEAAQSQAAAAASKASTLQEQVAQADKAAAEAQIKVDELARLRRGQADLVERIFSAPSWASDPTLLTVQTAAADLGRQAAEAAGHSATYGQAGALLQNARGKIAQATALLQRTRLLGAVGMGRNMGRGMGRGRGSPMMDIGQIMQIRRSNDLVQGAAQDVDAARQVLPSLPWTNTAVLQSAKVGVFINILAPGIGGGIAEQVMIRRSMESVQQMEAEVGRCHAWVQSNAAAAAARASQLRDAANAKAADEAHYKRTQLDAAAGN